MRTTPRSTSARTAACLLAVIAAAAAARGQAPDYADHAARLPEPAASVAEALVAALNAGDPAAFLRFLDAHATAAFREAVPPDEHMRVYRRIHGETRGVDYHGYRTYDPPRPAGEHMVIVRARLTGAWRAFLLVMDEAEPEKLAGLRFLPARPPSDLPPPGPLSLDEALRELDAHLDRLVEADAFSGAVLVGKDGRALYERAAGLASKAFGAPNNLDTKFNLGSMNKMFTAVAIAQLVEQGRLSFDDPLNRYVDETWLPAGVTEKILIRHLLNHTSGLGSYFNERFEGSSRALFRDLDDYKPLVAGDAPAFEPGTGWRYSNTAFLLLGVVIERVTGQSYFDVVRRQVFEPAGMASTDSYEMDRPVENLAVGYVPEHDGAGRPAWRNNLYMHVIKGGPAGGGFSTVRDLLRFDAALRGGRLLSPGMRDQLWTPQGHSPDYGYGFAVHRGPLGTVVGHGGGFPGLSGQLDMYLDSGYTVAVLSNYDRGAGPVAERIGELLARVR